MFADYRKIFLYLGQNYINNEFIKFLSSYCCYNHLNTSDIFEINSSKNNKIIINSEYDYNFDKFIIKDDRQIIYYNNKTSNHLMAYYDLIIIVNLQEKNSFSLYKDRYSYNINELYQLKKIFDRKIKLNTIFYE